VGKPVRACEKECGREDEEDKDGAVEEIAHRDLQNQRTERRSEG